MFVLINAKKDIILFVLLLGSKVFCRKPEVNQELGSTGQSWAQAAIFPSVMFHGTCCSGQTLVLSLTSCLILDLAAKFCSLQRDHRLFGWGHALGHAQEDTQGKCTRVNIHPGTALTPCGISWCAP